MWSSSPWEMIRSEGLTLITGVKADRDLIPSFPEFDFYTDENPPPWLPFLGDNDQILKKIFLLRENDTHAE